MLIGYLNRVDSRRSHPVRTFERGGRSAGVVLLVQQDQTAHIEREYVQVIGARSVYDYCQRDMRLWVYMGWHSKHRMGHMWEPQD